MITNQFNESKNKPVLKLSKFTRNVEDHVHRYGIDYVQNGFEVPKFYSEIKCSNAM